MGANSYPSKQGVSIQFTHPLLGEFNIYTRQWVQIFSSIGAAGHGETWRSGAMAWYISYNVIL